MLLRYDGKLVRKVSWDVVDYVYAFCLFWGGGSVTAISFVSLFVVFWCWGVRIGPRPRLRAAVEADPSPAMTAPSVFSQTELVDMTVEREYGTHACMIPDV